MSNLRHKVSKTQFFLFFANFKFDVSFQSHYICQDEATCLHYMTCGDVLLCGLVKGGIQACPRALFSQLYFMSSC